MASRRRSDEGEVSAEVVLAVPTVFLVVLLAIQLAMYVHTANVASVSAATGAAATAATGGGPAAGADAAMRTALDLSGRLVSRPSIEWGDGEVAVTVELSVPKVAPFMDLRVARTAREPRERFVPEDER